MQPIVSPKNRHPVIINEDERQLIIVGSDAFLLQHLKQNDPTLVSYLELSDADDDLIRKEFDKGGAFLALEAGWWSRYAEQLGLEA